MHTQEKIQGKRLDTWGCRGTGERRGRDRARKRCTMVTDKDETEECMEPASNEHRRYLRA
eukprot:6197302-Pleurochrysis_carterae.AAC.2